MESDAQEQLRLIERAEAAPYVDYPKTPWWYPVVIGLWAAAMIGTFVWWRENAPLFTSVLVGLLLLEAAFITWMQRRHGAMPMPGRGRPPAEIGGIWRRYFAGLAVIAVAVGLVWWLVGVPAAAGTAFVLVTGGLVVYERAYAVAAAAKVKERLA
ncbi:hypothetical protein [Kribbella italica]|uniref:Transmembrane protein n=1 Tax=Kribbella italica TaxID=1540520 RepID=A0A7W9J9G5_9ACTN|nr:hypothetical protein [Kribbella italica]MBB5837625.1 hypothetical protein [Kribbella italica]